ncbi:MAG: cytochrome c oxidase subunit II [Chthoniobacterales bacterium]
MKFPSVSRSLLLVLLAVFCSLIVLPEAAAEQRTSNLYWAPPVATEGGKKTDEILNFIFILTASVFFLTQAVFIYYLIRYRRRAGVKAHYSHGNNTLEIVWTALPTVIFLGLAIWSNRVWEELTQRPVPEDAVVVEIVGYQFAFDLRYAGADQKLEEVALEKMTVENRFGMVREDFAMADDFTSTEMVIPVGKPVHVVLRSRDVIHSFYVPEFRLYQDMVPGRTIDWMWFVPSRTGSFTLACSQLCGSGHYNMKAPIRVVTQQEFDTWQKEKIAARQSQIAQLSATQSPQLASTK